MDSNRWQQIEKIVDTALALAEPKRSSYIEVACNGDLAMKTEVTNILKGIELSDKENFLETSQPNHDKLLKDLLAEQESDAVSSLLGKQIGPYKIMELIGHGGMGSVFLAERSDDSYKAKVALKLMRYGMDTPENIARFRRERNILAKLNHPNIARLYDGGITSEGLPYLVMEYVDGVPFFDYCDQQQLSVNQRIKLFEAVCKAVQHAHQNAVIHRDLKPSNILVTDNEKVKILDFGIAKLMEADENPDVFQTKTGARMLTFGFAAPEQVEAAAVTTATDTYSLGILLYQLLTGIHPYNLDDKHLNEVEELIRNQTPEKPSVKFQSLAQSEQKKIADLQQTTPFGLSKMLRGDLDAIILKSLRKEPESRYGSTESFLDDLWRRKHNLPIVARRDTFRYKSAKFFKRHKSGIGIAAGFLVLIAAFIFVYTYQITKERNAAELQAKKAEAVTSFLVDLFKTNNPSYSKGDTLTARQLLEIGENRIDELADQPEIQSNMLQVLGNIYASLSYFQKADSLQNQSLKINKEIYHSTDPELASIYGALAATKNSLGEYDVALNLIDTAITYQTKIYGKQGAQLGKSLELRAETLRKNGKLDSAYQTISRAKAIFKSANDTLNADYLETLMEQGAIAVGRGNMKESEKIWRQSLNLSTILYTPPHPKILRNINGLANALKELEKFPEAESLYVQSVKMTEKLYGEKHVNTATTLNNLAGLYYYTEQYAKADSLYNESYATFRALFGDKHPYITSTLYNQANLKADMGDYHAAENLYKKVLENDEAQFGINHPNVASDLTGLASLCQKQEKYPEAINYFEKSLKIRKKVYKNPNHPYIAYNERSLAKILIKLKKFDRAEKLYHHSFKAMVVTFGPDNGKVQNYANQYSKFLASRGTKISPDSLISINSK